MTEADWNACTDPTLMLKYLRGKTTDRKRRLFAVACCKRFWLRLTHEPSRQAVVVAERYADGQARRQELEVAAAQARLFIQTEGSTTMAEGHFSHAAYAAYVVASVEASYAARQVAESNPAIDDDPSPAQEEARVAGATEMAIRCKLLRDIIGNPFRPITADPTWLTGTVKQIGEAIYEDRAFDHPHFGGRPGGRWLCLRFHPEALPRTGRACSWLLGPRSDFAEGMKP